MTDLSVLAPFIVAAVLCAMGLFGLHWMMHNKPTLVRPAPELPPLEEEQERLPFDEPAPSGLTPEVRPSFAAQFEDHRP